MNGNKEQEIHDRWFPRMLAPAIRWASDIQSIRFKADDGLKTSRFDRKRFFELSGITLMPKEKLFFFKPENIRQESIDALREVLAPDDTLIAYELSSQTRELLTQAGLTYIDFWLHPVRFYDDVFFAVSSNDPSIRGILTAWQLDSRLLVSRAMEIELALVRGGLRRFERAPENSALFVGQTRYDKALMHEGRMLDLLDFQDEFEALADQYDSVLYSRHPMVHSGDLGIVNYLKRLPFASIVNTPSYFLLGAQQVRGVYSISSSVVHEATYFGKATGYFFQPPIPLQGLAGASGYSSVHKHFLTPQFWAAVLSARHEVNRVDPLELPSKPNRLRDALGMVYGFEHIDKLESLRNQLWWARDFKGVVARRARSIVRGLSGR